MAALKKKLAKVGVPVLTGRLRSGLLEDLNAWLQDHPAEQILSGSHVSTSNASTASYFRIGDHVAMNNMAADKWTVALASTGATYDHTGTNPNSEYMHSGLKVLGRAEFVTGLFVIALKSTSTAPIHVDALNAGCYGIFKITTVDAVKSTLTLSFVAFGGDTRSEAADAVNSLIVGVPGWLLAAQGRLGEVLQSTYTHVQVLGGTGVTSSTPSGSKSKRDVFSDQDLTFNDKVHFLRNEEHSRMIRRMVVRNKGGLLVVPEISPLLVWFDVEWSG